MPSIIICAFFLLIKKSSEVVSGLLYAIISGMLFAMGSIMTQVAVDAIEIWQFELLLIGIVFFVFMVIGHILATIIQQLAFQRGKSSIAISIQATANLSSAVSRGILIFNQQVLAPFWFRSGIIMILIGNILLIQFQARLEAIERQRSIKKSRFMEVGTDLKMLDNCAGDRSTCSQRKERNC